MKLQDIVCDLDLAKKLEELGVEKDSVYFYFGENRIRYSANCDIDTYTPSTRTYTVAELGEMLPSEIQNCSYLEMEKEDQLGFFYYYYDENYSDRQRDEKEANSRAKLLIWLLENNHITAEQIND